MRGIFFTTMTLLALGWLASTVELPRAWSHADTTGATALQDDSDRVFWRRTAQGWEKRTRWRLPGQRSRDVRQPLPVHPVAIATLQGVVAVIALGLSHQASRK
jgi:hypothetical protein